MLISSDKVRIRPFKVIPSLPEPLKPLLEIAHNLWWTWHPEAVRLFVRLDRSAWSLFNHNPVRMLGNISQDVLESASRDDSFLASMQRVLENLHRHLERTPWLVRNNVHEQDFTIAYFSAEFGLTECLQIYSGGLGCLAGDHLKSASELGLPLVGVGLLYRHGYFQQYLNADGWQQEYYPDLDFANLPVGPVLNPRGEQVKVSVQMPGREVHIAVWKVMVGRIPLYLLDTNVSENKPADRAITGQLYGGDMEMRIKQEIVLGIGGARALEAMGIEPQVYHMNEGHSAFLGLERIRRLIEQRDIQFDEARECAAAGNVFTTHTPVPAGIDRFPPVMIQRYFEHYHDSLRLDMEGVMALGRENVFARNEFFSMAVLAIRTSNWANGVSKLHGEVSRRMWQNIWPGVPEHEVPIIHVTNGVHARSWMSADLINLMDRYLGLKWQNDPADQTVWREVRDVPDEELWQVHEHCRQKMVIWARRRLRKQYEARGASQTQIRQVVESLDPHALTIGFARRFATYKRGNLFLRDPQRLTRILENVDRPVQILMAGKSHPADGSGKELIREIVQFAREMPGGHKVVFIENYDINVARYLVQGCDIWLNNPRRGMEASGTSGMKAAINGVLNCSILDGWWDEAYESSVGWAIGRGEEYANIDVQDDLEGQALYELLENQIIPLFYDRDETGLPRRWINRMKSCISTLAPAFNTNRMVQEYTEKLYLPALHRTIQLREDNLRGSIEIARQKTRLRQGWGGLRVESVESTADAATAVDVRSQVEVTAVVHLGMLQPDEVRVQAFVGKLDNDEKIIEGEPYDLEHLEDLGDGRHRFAGQIRPHTSGRHGLAVRIVPGGELFEATLEPGLIFWDAAPAAESAAESADRDTQQVA